MKYQLLNLDGEFITFLDTDNIEKLKCADEMAEVLDEISVDDMHYDFLNTDHRKSIKSIIKKIEK